MYASVCDFVCIALLLPLVDLFTDFVVLCLLYIYIKGREQKADSQNPSTNGKSKAIQTKSHKVAYTYTQKEKKEKFKNIYIYKRRKRVTESVNQSTNDNKL